MESAEIKASSEKTYKVFKELLEISETWIQEDALVRLFVSLVLRNINGKQFEHDIKNAYYAYIKELIMQIKQDSRIPNLMYAYYDVARYQTDPIDAAIHWHVDNRLLYIVLDHYPIPTTPEGRLALKVPDEVVKLREKFF